MDRHKITTIIEGLAHTLAEVKRRKRRKRRKSVPSSLLYYMSANISGPSDVEGGGDGGGE